MKPTEARSSGAWVWLVLGLIFVTPILCCGGIVVGFIVYVNSLVPPEQTIIGTWQLDRAASSNNPLVKNIEDGTMEFRKDKTYRIVLGGPVQKGTYEVSGKTGQTIKLTLTTDDPRPHISEIFIEVRDKNRLFVDHRKLSSFEVTRE